MRLETLVAIGLCAALTACTSNDDSSSPGGGGAASGGQSGSGGAGGSSSGGGGASGSGGVAGSSGSAGSGSAGSGGSGGSAGSGGSGGSGGNGGIGPAGPFTPSGPITLTSGQTVSGLHITSSSGPCIKGSGVANVRITNCKIGPCGPGAEGVGISLYQSHDVRIDHDGFDDVASALYALDDASGGIVFDHNHVTKLRGPMPRGQMVQFDKIQGPGHRIACNISDSTVPGFQAGPEDHINMYKSSGTAQSRIEIAYNRLRGGGPSTSGSGIMTGDSGSTQIYIHHNTMVETANVGFAIAGGSQITFEQNRAYSPKNPYSNVAAYVWAQAGVSCQDNALIGNRTNWINKDGTPNHFWDGKNCLNTTMTGNVWGDSSLGAAIFDEAYAQCN
ncbi:MAG: right-handed parallel beta-helix repeat-containing protein [Myxococcales bacterium]|nr:right-handed parallel beta-helix repeat-containing protein [Myxococcales bacterium]